jgi:hypothetical protein
MVSFQTKKSQFGYILEDLEWKMFLYSLVISKILLPLGIFYWAFGHFVVICHIFPRICLLCLEKSGNPDCVTFVAPVISKKLVGRTLHPSDILEAQKMHDF